MDNDHILFKGENDNENLRRALVQEQYPLLTTEDAASIKSLDELSLLGMTRAMEQARKLRWELDYRGLLEWTEQYEDVFKDRFSHTWWHKEFYLCKGVALARYKNQQEQAKYYINKARMLIISGEIDVFIQANIIKEIGNYHGYSDESDELNKAEKCYLEVLEMIPSDDESCRTVYIQTRCNLGYIHADTGRIDEAEATFDAVEQYSKNNQMNGYLLDQAYLGKAHVAALRRDLPNCEFYALKAWDAIVKYELKGVEPHLKALDLQIRLHEIGIWEHEGKPLILHDLEDIDNIFYQYYMVHPEYGSKLRGA